MPGPGNALGQSSSGVTALSGTTFISNALTAHAALVGGSTSSTIVNVGPSATSGLPLVSQGSSSDPIFGVASVSGGGTGLATLSANAILVGNGTGNVIQPTAGGTGQVLIGNTGAPPNFSANPAVTTITLSGGSPLTTYTHNTWTVGLAFGGLTTGITYQSRSAIYAKIGVLVWVSYDIVLSSKGSATGSATLTGLPFTSISGQDPGRGFWVENTSITYPTNYTDMTAAVDPNATTCSLIIYGAAPTAGASNQQAATNTMFANGTSLRGSFVYYASTE